MIIIPAIDIFENKIVRLRKGSFGNITYYKNPPFNQVLDFNSAGFSHLHLVDLAGSKDGNISVFPLIKEIKENTNLHLQFGGGIRDVKTAAELVDAGVDNLIIGSMAVKNKPEFELIIRNIGSNKIIAAVDVIDENIKVSGWTEETSVSVYSHIDYCTNLGIDKFLCTDIKKDGMLTGYNLKLYEKILSRYNKIKLIASGGVKNIEDIKNSLSLGLYAAIVGRAIYDETISIKELADFALQENNSMS